MGRPKIFCICFRRFKLGALGNLMALEFASTGQSFLKAFASKVRLGFICLMHSAAL